MRNSHNKSSSYHFLNNSNSDSYLDLTELQAQNTQLQLDNINKEAALSQITKENDEIKRKYEELLNTLSIQKSSSSNTDSSQNLNINNSTKFFENMTQSFLPDEKAEREVQLWTEMWNHIISMISEIIPLSKTKPQTGNERRAILVDLVSKLCRLVNENSKDKFDKLQRKYDKCKEELIYLKQQSKIGDEKSRIRTEKKNYVENNNNNDEIILSQKIKNLEGLLYKLIEKQKYLQFHSVRKSVNPAKTSTFIKSNIDQIPTQNLHRVIQIDDSDEASSSEDNDDLEVLTAANNANLNKTVKYSSNFYFSNSKQNLSQTVKSGNIAESKDRKVKVQSISKKLNLDEISGFSSNVEKSNKKRPIKSNQDEIEADFSISEESVSKSNRKQLMEAEAEADEILAKASIRRRREQLPRNDDFEPEYVKKKNRKETSRSRIKLGDDDDDKGSEIRKSYGNHLNQLVHLTNNFKNDYHNLGKYLGNDSNDSQFSLDQLSKLHDSLLSMEKNFNNFSG